MARKVLSKGKCPNCGRNKIEADSHHGNDPKRNAFLKRASKSLLIWLGVFAWMLLDAFPGDRLSLMTFLVLMLLGFAWTLVVVVRAYRHVYRAVSPGRYPDARHTCSVCGHSWTATESLAGVADEIDETGSQPMLCHRMLRQTCRRSPQRLHGGDGSLLPSASA
jgi:hypothetical protein